jgi:hypothetical protein
MCAARWQQQHNCCLELLVTSKADSGGGGARAGGFGTPVRRKGEREVRRWRTKEATGRNGRTGGRHARGSEGDRDRANDEWVPPVRTDGKEETKAILTLILFNI